MIHLPNDFKEFLQLLHSGGVEYLVVGGYAVGLYGYPRATGDLDIWIAVNEKNAQKMVTCLRKFGFNLPEVKKEIFIEKEKIIRLGNPPLRLEILTSIDGVTFPECFSNKNVIDLAGCKVNFISLKDLKKNKKASGRHRDLDDLEHI